MTTLTPYLLFDGNCRQAGVLQILLRTRTDSDRSERHSREGENPSIPTRQGSKCPLKRQQRRCFGIGLATATPDASSRQHRLLCLSGGTYEELRSLFEKLSEAGEVTDPLSQQFFGTYRALNDQFGVRWMFQTYTK